MILFDAFSYFKEAFFYFAVPIFMGSEPVQRNNKESKGSSRWVSYLIETIKTGQKSRTLDLYLESEIRRLIHSAMICSLIAALYVNRLKFRRKLFVHIWLVRVSVFLGNPDDY